MKSSARFSRGAVLALALTSCATAPRSAGHPLAVVPADTTQLIVVTTATWSSVTALAQRYERTSTAGRWTPVGDPFRAIVGRKGLAWGIGLHPSAEGDPKVEGDGRSPAGVFRLGKAFGYDAQPVDVKLPYVPVVASTACVEDVRSTRYNQILDRSAVANPDFVQNDSMLRDDELYRLGVFVHHNSEPATPGRGSCIFFHVWRGPQIGSAGCTSAKLDDVRTLVTWLRPEAHPLLVQLPEATYQEVRLAWKLP